MLPVQADFSRTNGFTGYGVPPYATMTYNPYIMPLQSSDYSYGAMPKPWLFPGNTIYTAESCTANAE